MNDPHVFILGNRYGCQRVNLPKSWAFNLYLLTHNLMGLMSIQVH